MREMGGNLGKEAPRHTGLILRLWAWLERHARIVLPVYATCMVLGTHWPNLQFIPPPEDPTPLHGVLKLDKVLHTAGFGGLMVLLILAGIGGRERSWMSRCAVALGIGVVYAFVDEITQGLMAGRVVSLTDIVINLIAMLGVYLLALLPAEREPRPAPRGLKVMLAVSLPVLGLLALSPAVMVWAVQKKNELLGTDFTHLHPIDQIAHGVLATVLAVVIFVVWPMASRRPRRAAAITLLILFAGAPLLEVVQHFIGRSAQWQDVLAHDIGLLLAMMWWAARLSWSPGLREPATIAGTAA